MGSNPSAGMKRLSPGIHCCERLMQHRFERGNYITHLGGEIFSGFSLIIKHGLNLGW